MSERSTVEVVLVIGAGAREHALAWELAGSPSVRRVIVAPGNGGIHHPRARGRVSITRAAEVAMEPAALLALAQREGVGLTVVGPESALAAGVVDVFEAAGQTIFGPSREAAEIETSKTWAKAFMQRHQLPTARFAVAASLKEARATLDAFGTPVVVKASGLAAGKGVFICATREEAEDALWRLLEAGELGPAGREVVVEELLVGRELSVFALCDGERTLMLPVARDHKRLKDGDQGPNTGGMGAYAPVPDVDQKMLARIRQTIIEPTIAGMRAESRPFRGCLFAGFMLTADGPKLLEFNARFGDPETQAVLALLDEETDFAAVLEACAKGRLDTVPRPIFQAGFAVAVVAAAPGYPAGPLRGSALLEVRPDDEGRVFAASVGRTSHGLVASGGRVLSLVGTGDSLEQAREAAYALVDRYAFEGMQVRRDIGRPPTSAYAAAGVDIEAGNAAVQRMKRSVESTFNPFVLSKLGTYGGLFDLKAVAGYKDPVLVASTDGVGTKTMIARIANRWDTIGQDLVNHSVNDILVMGARPLFFLDYVAAAKLDPVVIGDVVGGVAAACRAHGVALLGGETAEMPGVYREGELDLAGTIIGVVERTRIIDGKGIQAGDTVLALRSSGVHTNGWSLLRRALDPIDVATAKRLLDPPHRPYLAEISALWEAGIDPVGLVHITGGGFVDNPPRLLRELPNLCFELADWEWPDVFRLVQARGQIATAEMRRVFNLGVGMLVILRPGAAARARGILPELFPVGRIRERAPDEAQVVFQ
ncbi:MAG: phosphoribosylamine--glycine ligase [Myxococcota bacterium]